MPLLILYPLAIALSSEQLVGLELPVEVFGVLFTFHVVSIGDAALFEPGFQITSRQERCIDQ
jgi:hypothetical protein